MCEQNLYNKILNNFEAIERNNCALFCEQKNIKLKMKLINTCIVKGVYIERKKNLGKDFYHVEQKKKGALVQYTKKNKKVEVDQQDKKQKKQDQSKDDELFQDT